MHETPAEHPRPSRSLALSLYCLSLSLLPLSVSVCPLPPFTTHPSTRFRRSSLAHVPLSLYPSLSSLPRKTKPQASLEGASIYYSVGAGSVNATSAGFTAGGNKTLIASMKASGIKVHSIVGCGSIATLREVFATPTPFIEEAVAAAAEYGLDGFNLDFEPYSSGGGRVGVSLNPLTPRSLLSPSHPPPRPARPARRGRVQWPRRIAHCTGLPTNLLGEGGAWGRKTVITRESDQLSVQIALGCPPTLQSPFPLPLLGIGLRGVHPT